MKNTAKPINKDKDNATFFYIITFTVVPDIGFDQFHDGCEDDDDDKNDDSSDDESFKWDVSWCQARDGDFLPTY